MRVAHPHLTRPAYRPDIDGLRAVAVLSVVGFHAFPELLHGGFIGVDVFFVISGYLISTIIFDSLEKGRFSLTEFYARRIKRIFPALIVVLVMSYCFGWLALFEDEYKQLGMHIAAGAGFVSNLVLWSESGYFDITADMKPLLHLWSLGIEEQFYIFWPLMGWLAWKSKLDYRALIFSVLLASFILNIYVVLDDAVAAFYSPQTRVWELAFGSVLAWYALKRKDTLTALSSARRTGISFLGFFLLLLGLVFITKKNNLPGWWALLPVIGSMLIIAAGARAYLNRTFLSYPITVWFGLISFPLYLWHWPLLSFAYIIEGGMPSLAIRSGAVITSIVLAWLTYTLIEKPVRRGAGGKFTVAILLCVMLAVGLVGARPTIESLQAAELYVKGMFSGKHKAQVNSSEPSARIMLLGDSHASHLFPGLQKEFGSDIADYSKNGCIPFYDVDRFDKRVRPGTCVKEINKALDCFEKSSQMQTIVLASMGPVYLTGEAFKEMGIDRVIGLGVTLVTNKEIADRWRIYELGMRNTFTRLSSYNKQIVFVLDVPELGFEPQKCNSGKAFTLFGFTFTIRHPLSSHCTLSRADYDSRTEKYREMVYNIAHDFPQITIFDPTDLLCDNSYCYYKFDDKILYKDFDHLSEEGSYYIARYLAPLIREKLFNITEQETEYGQKESGHSAQMKPVH
jgi:peptidoglycan/LPS O-acetylase OafA/YrhL